MPLLRLSSVTKSYRRGHTTIDVLRDVSLTVDNGALVSVYGARASGKTTLLEIAAGLEAPDAGAILISGRRRFNDVAWVQSEGPHDRGLSMSAYIALPMYRELGQRKAHARAMASLAALDADVYAQERWQDLPRAARALCAIAHATARRPRLLVADDPTAGLGLLDRERICRALRATAEIGVGVLMAVPDVPSMLRSHETYVLSQGRVLAARHATDQGEAEIVDMAAHRFA